ncbi:DUF2061 domain-containing protein [Ferrimonas balearica]|uniref:DUF2061 domain-containing protein n=1 Tax=Ferrimonas balearica TaxID=44012 RepID=UPI001C990612|nr:DUF2061 domain-containing protein [Ferrimonas balearica]MBY5923098.1 DUF2061 domain-containing protein [Ferrimonas balearica]MBY5997526.1 DUF2061 domain-containing protein [Ferrimonas balearica]
MLKTFTFAVMHFSIAFALAYLITGSIVIGGLLAVLEPMVNTVGYVIHEKVWKRIEQRRDDDAMAIPA